MGYNKILKRMKIAIFNITTLACLASPLTINDVGAINYTTEQAVEANTFARAETNVNIAKMARIIARTKDTAYAVTRPGGSDNFGSENFGLNTFLHYRTLDSPFNPIVRPNKDTLYSALLLDTNTGPLTIEMPEADRYQSIYCFNQDHFQEYYSLGPAKFHIKRQYVDSRYLFCIFRTLVLDPESMEDMANVHKLQDSIKLTVSEPQNIGLQIPDYDRASHDKARLALNQLFDLERDSKKMFGKKEDVDPITHLVGTAGGIGGLPKNIATYENHLVSNNDGIQEYYLEIPDVVPVNAFWSITVYDQDGFIFKKVESANKNQFTVKENDNGKVIVYFSNDKTRENYINIGPNWNYVVRLYEPDLEIVSGLWTFPKPTPI